MPKSTKLVAHHAACKGGCRRATLLPLPGTDDGSCDCGDGELDQFGVGPVATAHRTSRHGSGTPKRGRWNWLHSTRPSRYCPGRLHHPPEYGRGTPARSPELRALSDFIYKPVKVGIGRSVTSIDGLQPFLARRSVAPPPARLPANCCNLNVFSLSDRRNEAAASSSVQHASTVLTGGRFWAADFWNIILAREVVSLGG